MKMQCFATSLINMDELQREIDVLRNDFQQLQQIVLDVKITLDLKVDLLIEDIKELQHARQQLHEEQVERSEIRKEEES